MADQSLEILKLNLSVSRIINAPPERVFDIYSDLRGATDNLSGVHSLEVLTDGPVAKGTRFRETRIHFGHKTSEILEVTAFEPPVMFQVECRSHGAHCTHIFSFTEQQGKTLVELDFKAEPITRFARLMSAFSFLMTGPMKKCSEQDLDDLQRLSELGQQEP